MASGPALAAKLDKEACAGLASELAALAATGIKADMERGPSWGVANLRPERLESVRRVLELEDQLEFRCGSRGIAKPKESPAAPAPTTPAIDARAATAQPPVAGDGEDSPAPTPASNAAVAPPPPGNKPQPDRAPPAAASLPARTTVKPPPTLPAAAAAPVPEAPAAAAQPAPNAGAVGVTKSLPAATSPTAPPKHMMAANPPPTVPLADSEPPPAGGPPVTRLGPLPSAASTVAAPTTPAPAPGAVAPAAKKAGDPAPQAAARKKSPRRTPNSAYVSPGEVSPYSLPGMR